MRLHTKALLAVLALAAAAAVAAGIARSTSTEPIPDANGVIHACYKKPIGEVKIVYSAANCGPGQAPIEWSQAGAEGPKGDPGPQGPPGPPGAVGGNMKVLESDEVAAALGDSPSGLFVVSLLLPEPGTYWVTAKGSLASAGVAAEVSFGGCRLMLGASQLDRTPTFLLNEQALEIVPFSLARVTEVTQAPQLVDAVCFRIGDRPIAVEQLRITALKVT